MEPIQLKRVNAQFCGSIEFEGGHMQSFSPGPDGLLYVLICMGEPDQNWIERKNPCDWRVLAFHREGWCSEQVIRTQRRNYSAIQPLREGVILASPRCKFEGNTTLPNGHIFDKDGQLVRQILLGDGVEQLQTTKSGEIWASYLDEGILGSPSSLGESGLNRFDESGKITYRFDPPAGLESMFDCYCLNVTSDREVWCYYYSQFSIIRLYDGRVVEHWPSPIQGALKLAVWDRFVLLQGGYHSDDWQVIKLTEGAVRIGESFILQTPEGKLLPAASSAVRNDAIWFLEDGDVYCCDRHQWSPAR